MSAAPRWFYGIAALCLMTGTAAVAWDAWRKETHPDGRYTFAMESSTMAVFDTRTGQVCVSGAVQGKIATRCFDGRSGVLVMK